MTIKIAFLGLGAMGYPMAGHLAEKGFPVTVYNRTVSVAEKWLTEYTGACEMTPEAAVKDADIVITCVGNDNDVRGLYCGTDSHSGIFSAITANTILIDHTTTSASLAEALSQIAQQHHAHFLDAPVSGGQIGAEKGCLTIMVGGDNEIYQQINPIMQHYAQAISRIGSVGYGQRCKMVNQLCITGILQGLSEALTFAKASGINAETIINTLQHGAAGSWQMVNRTETMMNDQFDFGFAIDWMRKDLAICFDEAERLSVKLPLATFVDEQYKILQKNGDHRSDTSALIKQFNNGR
ncbi:MAG: NAD(P)-dependent oxidoreductase [Cocleimonas sp.]|nr:NAD(P)-dependent oxidoreductase [Cocleimonas sp.]